MQVRYQGRLWVRQELLLWTVSRWWLSELNSWINISPSWWFQPDLVQWLGSPPFKGHLGRPFGRGTTASNKIHLTPPASLKWLFWNSLHHAIEMIKKSLTGCWTEVVFSVFRGLRNILESIRVGIPVSIYYFPPTKSRASLEWILCVHDFMNETPTAFNEPNHSKQGRMCQFPWSLSATWSFPCVFWLPNLLVK